jgi:hypothetical protein
MWSSLMNIKIEIMKDPEESAMLAWMAHACYFFPVSFRRYLISAAMSKMMMIQMAICIVVTFKCV